MFKKNILYKSINLEVFKNFLGCLTILFILVASSRLLGYFDKSIAGNLESDLILSILILRSPEFINLLIPLSFFLSVLIALGRLYMDHEIYAYQSAGYSKMAFVRSLLFQTFSLTVISVFLSFYVTPDFEKRADEILNYSAIEKKLKLLNEDELSHISDSSYLYFSSRNGNYFNQSIFIKDDANGISIISAERLKLIEKNRATDFEFFNGKIFFDAASPNSLVSSFKMLTTDFIKGGIRATKSPRASPTLEIPWGPLGSLGTLGIDLESKCFSKISKKHIKIQKFQNKYMKFVKFH